MKNILNTILLFVLSSILVPTFAAPVPLPEPEASDFEVLEARGVAATAKAAVTWLGSSANSASINTKPVCFYSGFTSVMNTKLKPPTEVKITAHGKLAGFMATHSCNSIDNIMALAGATKDATKWTNEDWAAVSEALAKALTKSTKVLLGKTVPAASVWLTHEKKALIGNAAVTKIEQYEIDATGNIVQVANIKG